MKKLKLKIILLGIGLFSCFTPVFAMQNNNEQKILETNTKKEKLESLFLNKIKSLKSMFNKHGLVNSNKEIVFFEDGDIFVKYNFDKFLRENIKNKIVKDLINKKNFKIEIPLKNILMHKDLVTKKYITPFAVNNSIKLIVKYHNDKFYFKLKPASNYIVINREKTKKIEENKEEFEKFAKDNENKEIHKKYLAINLIIKKDLINKGIVEQPSKNAKAVIMLKSKEKNYNRKIFYRDFCSLDSNFEEKIKDALKNNKSSLNLILPENVVIPKIEGEKNNQSFKPIEFTMFGINFKIFHESFIEKTNSLKDENSLNVKTEPILKKIDVKPLKSKYVFQNAQSKLLKAESNFLKAETSFLELESNFKNAESNFKNAESRLLSAKSNFKNVRSNYKKSHHKFKDAKYDLEDAKFKLSNAKSNLETAKSSLETAKPNFEAAKSNFETAKSNFETAKSNFENAKPSIENIKSNLETAKSNLETAKSDYEYAQFNYKFSEHIFEKSKTRYEDIKSKLLNLKNSFENTDPVVLKAQSDFDYAKFDLSRLETDFKKAENRLLKAKSKFEKAEFDLLNKLEINKNNNLINPKDELEINTNNNLINPKDELEINTNNNLINPKNKLEINKNSEPLNLESDFLNKKRSPENFELNNLPETKKDDDFKK